MKARFQTKIFLKPLNGKPTLFFLKVQVKLKKPKMFIKLKRALKNQNNQLEVSEKF